MSVASLTALPPQKKVITRIADRHAFQQLLQRNPGLVILKLGAPWCRPCGLIAPAVHDFFASAPPDVVCADLNVDECVDLYAKFKAMRMVNGIPALLCFARGNMSFVPDERHTGADDGELRRFFVRCDQRLQMVRRATAEASTVR